jgi:predicted HD phosphohydrolase
MRRDVPGQLFETLQSLEWHQGPLLVSRLEHSLQSASRALRDGREEKFVAAALLHDVGDHLASYSHGEHAAAIMRPFVSPTHLLGDREAPRYFRPITTRTI